jgi:hypothetical protein
MNSGPSAPVREFLTGISTHVFKTSSHAQAGAKCNLARVQQLRCRMEKSPWTEGAAHFWESSSAVFPHMC